MVVLVQRSPTIYFQGFILAAVLDNGYSAAYKIITTIIITMTIIIVITKNNDNNNDKYFYSTISMALCKTLRETSSLSILIRED